MCDRWAACWRVYSHARKSSVCFFFSRLNLPSYVTFSWLIDNDKDEEGMRVLADLHGGDPEDMVAKAEFQEIKDRVMFERESGEARSYAVMWKRYKRRVLLAMSSQAFAQLVSLKSIVANSC
jgi:hypothetical protein